MSRTLTRRFATGAFLILFCVIAPCAKAAQNQTFDINLPAQPLATSLAGLSKQTGVQIFAAGELVEGKSAPAVSGQMTVNEALDQLLAGSGLESAVSGAGFVVQSAQPKLTAEPKAQQDPTIKLPQVTVRETRGNYAVTNETTATKIDAPIMDIPQSIEVVPHQVIEDQRAVDLTDVLRNVSGFSPSVSSQSQRFGDRNVIFRGFTGNNYLTNGFKDPFNGASFTFGMANMDQVEVLKGPASVLYGLGEPGATVNIITKQPLTEWYAAGSMTGANFALAAPELDVSGPVTSNKELRFRFNAGYKYQGSFVDYVQSQRYIVAPAISWAISPNTLFTAEGEYQALSDINYTGLPGQGTISPNINGKIPFSRYLGDKTLEGNRFPERTLGKVGYRLQHRFNDWISLRHGFRASLFNRNERDVLTEFLDPDNERDMFRSLFAAKSSWYDYYSLTELNLDFKTGPVGHKFLFGSDQRYTSMRDRSMSAEIDPIDVFNPVYGNIADPFNADTPRRVSDSSGTFIGVYLQDLITIVEPLKLLLGLRYDNVYQRTNFQFILYNEVFSPALKAFLPVVEMPDASITPTGLGAEPKLTWDQALEYGRALAAKHSKLGGFSIEREDSLRLDRHQGVFIYSVKTSFDMRDHFADTRVFLSASDGRELAFTYPYVAPGNAVSQWLSALHTGRVWGIPYRIFLSLMGMIAAALSVTGVFIWWKKRGARARAAKARIRREGAPAKNEKKRFSSF